MIAVKLAGLTVQINNKYDYTARMCKDYLSDSKAYDFSVWVTDDEISAEGSGFDRGYLESLAIYRKIAEELLDYDGFLMHGAVFDYLGDGIAFLAKSGVGKSTHLRLWQTLLKDKIKIINGDKPLVRFVGDIPYAYGTAWAGKENLHTNDKTELKKICFIERSAENECVPLSKGDVLERFVSQIYVPKSADKLVKTLDLTDRLVKSAEFYLIRCNMDISAAETAFEVVCGK